MKAPFQTPQVLLAWLIECGAMDIADGSDPIYRISQAGNEALKQEKSRDKLGALFVKESAYEDVLKELVKFCAAPKTRKEIDDKFTSHPLLQEPKIYPSYFVGLLEEVGALEWDGGWSATKDALRKVGE